MALFRDSIRARLLVAMLAGALAAALVGLCGHLDLGLMAGWVVAAGGFSTTTWALVFGLDASSTRLHARANDPGRGIDDTLLVLACVASVAGLILLLIRVAGDQATLGAVLAVMGILASWSAIHTLFTLRYAHAYYAQDARGIDFNGDTAPDYRDFAYIAFTLGMTFQVSDTNLSTKELRRMALNQGLISYLLGTVVVASTINLLSQLLAG
ncbi:MAG: DUF1345 domain-containing protein [Actinomyces sp.]|nr:DUF1345 domain-containing protein [Actinomyces sp.]MDN6428240.1 DUF1345 domain-containing protein [Propionibacterium sp.]MDN6566546.1 DUF1345 domain-containing protein [Actinomyces sp.]MDN6794454.1 DUF1345 domain-containing protein [Propionibacterium sp.]